MTALWGGEGPVRYDYFNLGDHQVFRDHEPLLYPAPACGDGGHFYYREEKRSFTKLEEVERRATQAIRKKQPLIFHWRGGPLTRETLEELLALLERQAAGRGLHVRAEVNRPQAVLSVTFPAEPPSRPAPSRNPTRERPSEPSSTEEHGTCDTTLLPWRA